MPETLETLADPGTTFTAQHRLQPPLLPLARRLSHRPVPAQLRRDRQRARLRGADRQGLDHPRLAAGGRLPHRLRRPLPAQLRPAAPASRPSTTPTLGYAAPPGVEDWFGYVGSQTVYSGATFSDNGTPVTAGTGPAGYSTRVINRAALDFVRGAKADPRPFFLTVAHLAPHSSNSTATGVGPCGKGGLPIPEDAAAYRAVPQPRSCPSPTRSTSSRSATSRDWVAHPPARSASARRHDLKLGYRCALATLSTVDRGVGELVDQLERQGELDDTAIFFTSDNGYFFGEHRIFLNKVFPYEEALRVPLLARIPPRLLGPKARRDGPPAEVVGAGQQPRPHRHHPRPRRRRPVHRGGPTAARSTAARCARCCNGKRPDWSRGRALLYQLGGNRTCGDDPDRARPQQLLRRPAHQALRLRRARPRQQGDRHLRPARVRALRPQARPLPARQPRRQPAAAAALAAPGPARGPARLAARLRGHRRPRRRPPTAPSASSPVAGSRRARAAAAPRAAA